MTELHNPDSTVPTLWDDPVVEEIRSIRRRLWTEADGDLSRYIQRAKEVATRVQTEVRAARRTAG